MDSASEIGAKRRKYQDPNSQTPAGDACAGRMIPVALSSWAAQRRSYCQE